MDEQVMTQPTVTPPANKLKTSRGLIKFILFSLITFGIYSLVFFTSIGSYANTVCSRRDGKHTMNFCLVFFLLGNLTLGILHLVWQSKVCGRIGRELQHRGISYRFGSGTFWLWCILGSLIGIGPLVYIHKLAKATNLMAKSYNEIG